MSNTSNMLHTAACISKWYRIVLYHIQNPLRNRLTTKKQPDVGKNHVRPLDGDSPGYFMYW